MDVLQLWLSPCLAVLRKEIDHRLLAYYAVAPSGLWAGLLPTHFSKSSRPFDRSF